MSRTNQTLNHKKMEVVRRNYDEITTSLPTPPEELNQTNCNCHVVENKIEYHTMIVQYCCTTQIQ